MRVSRVELGQVFVLEQAASIEMPLTLQRIASSLHRKKEVAHKA